MPSRARWTVAALIVLIFPAVVWVPSSRAQVARISKGTADPTALGPHVESFKLASCSVSTLPAIRALVSAGQATGTATAGATAGGSRYPDTLSVTSPATAGNPTCQFSQAFTGPWSNAGRIVYEAMALDSQGNIIVAGSFSGRQNFGGGDSSPMEPWISSSPSIPPAALICGPRLSAAQAMIGPRQLPWIPPGIFSLQAGQEVDRLILAAARSIYCLAISPNTLLMVTISGPGAWEQTLLTGPHWTLTQTAMSSLAAHSWAPAILAAAPFPVSRTMMPSWQDTPRRATIAGLFARAAARLTEPGSLKSPSIIRATSCSPATLLVRATWPA